MSPERFSERFAHEAQAVAALNHPNVCTLYDVGPDYLVMEYIDGTPVGHTPEARKPLDLASQIAGGIAAAHGAGFVHRDLKPDNILVTREGRAKILDFGLAKRSVVATTDDEATRTMAMTGPGTTVGMVAAYMSPEQARGERSLGPQSDQFSFGLVLYEMVTGRRAFRRASAAETTWPTTTSHRGAPCRNRRGSCVVAEWQKPVLHAGRWRCRADHDSGIRSLRIGAAHANERGHLQIVLVA